MFSKFVRPRRVVISGLGCVTPIGIGRKEYWHGLRSGKSGISRIESFDVSDSSVQIAAEIKGFDANAEIDAKDRKHIPRTVPLALASAKEAIADAHLELQKMSLEERQRFGVVMGTGGGGLSFTEKQYETYFKRNNLKKISVYTIPSSTHGSLSSELSMRFDLHGHSHVVSTGCTSSTDAISYAAQSIALGKVDKMLAGGSDAPIAPGIFEGFKVMKVLTNKWNEEPRGGSRPFSTDRSGMVLGEGAWVFVLETLESATARGAKIYCEILGVGSTCDAYHRVRLDEKAVEPARAMTLALEDAEIACDEVDYVNLHGTSTEINDRIETKALKKAFGSHAYEIATSATKSQIGHPQGASGAAGVASALLALDEGVIAPTLNLDEPAEDCDLDYTPKIAGERDVNVALCNCIGFGSKNSALVLGRV